MERIPKATYTPEFRAEAVKLVETTGMSVAKAANRLSIPESSLSNWVRAARGCWHVTNGTSLQELMELGGWKSYEMVLRYAHLAPDHLSHAAARIERRVEGIVEPDSTKTLHIDKVN